MIATKPHVGVDSELTAEKIIKIIPQLPGYEGIRIDPEFMEAFNFMAEIFDRTEMTTEDGRTIKLRTKFVVSDRALGKTINANLIMTYKTATDDTYTAAIIARNWNENASQVRPYYEDLLRQFIGELGQGEGEEGAEDENGRKRGFLDGRPLGRGIVYNKQERIKFVDLYNPSSAKKRVHQPLRDMVFDEFIPSQDQREEGKGYQPNELKRYADIEKSCRRKNPTINKLFLGNPNDPWWNIPYLGDFEEHLEEEQKGYWKERPEDEEERRKGTWEHQLLNEKGQVLILKKMEGEKDPEGPTYEQNNWDLFYSQRETLGIRKGTNGGMPMDIFLGLHRFFDSTNGQGVYVEAEWLRRYKPRHFYEFIHKPEICVDEYTFIKSRKASAYKEEIEKPKHREELKWDMSDGLVGFLDLESRQKIEDYVATGRTRPKEKEKQERTMTF